MKNWSYIAFVLALAAYWLTVDPSASYWDCPEYLLTALRLEVGHPPGNPAWSLTHRFVSSFFQSPAVQTLVVNMMSGLFTALAAMLLCSCSVTMMRRVWPRHGKNRWRSFAIGLSSLSGSLCFAWCDSAWFSAVEAEVYAMSIFLTALTVWMALKCSFSLSRSRRARWLIALFYVMGLGLGVHQLNLLALPAIALIIGEGGKMKGARYGWKRGLSAFLLGCAAVVIILKIIMPGSVAMAEIADVYAVNSLGLPFWAGAASFWILTFVIIVALAAISSIRLPRFGISLWCLAAVMTGFSVYILIPIRAWANPPVNCGDASTPPRLKDYFDRRQYGSHPLFYGPTLFSKPMRLEKINVSADGDTTYDFSQMALRLKGKDMRRMVRGGKISSRSRFLTDKDKALNDRISADSTPHGYAVAGVRLENILTPELNMWLPRIHSSKPDDFVAYGDWTGMDSSNMVRVRISEAFDSQGRPMARRDKSGNPIEAYALRPTYLQSLAYLAGYQSTYMYLRYLLWNFAGRQNDIYSTGEIDHGNFITGFPPADNLMLGDQSQLPPELGSDNKGHNRYWCVPLLLGILGAVWLFAGKGSGHTARSRMRRYAWIILVLFLTTGLAIVLYLNQTPGEPRERDYSFLGSYWAFALWIAFGMMWIMRRCRRKWMKGLAVMPVCAVPLWMLAENYDDHDRSGRSATLDYACNVLESLDRDAIIFADGDNYIFPLWYAQEAMGVRPDVTIVCVSYLTCDWYLPQLMTGGAGGNSLRMIASEGDIAMGNFNIVRFPGADSDTIPAVDALKVLYADTAATPRFRSRWLEMGRDSASKWVFDLLSVPRKGANSLAGLRDVAMVDIVAVNAASRYPRPVYWHQSLGKDKYGGFFPFTRQGLFTRRLAPHLADSVRLTEESLNALPLLKWGGIDRMRYAGPDVSLYASQQRASLARLARALADEGRHDQALHVARMALVRYPSTIIPFDNKLHVDSMWFEAPELSRILIESGRAEGDSTAVELGEQIKEAEALRVEAFRRYLKSLPPNRRGALSPTTRNHSLRRS